MTTEKPDVQLDTLESKGLIKLATVRPELEYLFRHALVQDAAYGSLLKQERRALHGQVGDALEQLYPDRRSELAPMLAMHFEHAGETDKAIDYYAEAARHAFDQNAIQEAFAAYDQAARLLATASSTGPEARRRRIQIEVGRAQAGYSFRSAEDSFGELERVVDPAEELGDPELIAKLHTLIALGRLQNGQLATAPLVKRSLDRIARVGEQIGDPSLGALPMALIGLSQVFTGPVRAGVAALEQALPLLEGRQDTIGAAFARGALAIGYAELGDFEKAEVASRHATALAARGDTIAQLDAVLAAASIKAARGELDVAGGLAAQCVARSEETGASACMVVSSWILGDVFHRQGRFAEAQAVLQRGSDIALVVERKVWRPTLQAWLGSASVALGGASPDDWEDALATARSIGNQVGEAGILGKRAEAAAARGDIAAAVADFEASARLTEAQGMRPALARLLQGWGEALRGAGRAAEAQPILTRALGLFEEMGLTREAGIVRTTLAMPPTKLAFD